MCVRCHTVKRERDRKIYLQISWRLKMEFYTQLFGKSWKWRRIILIQYFFISLPSAPHVLADTFNRKIIIWFLLVWYAKKLQISSALKELVFRKKITIRKISLGISIQKWCGKRTSWIISIILMSTSSHPPSSAKRLRISWGPRLNMENKNNNRFSHFRKIKFPNSDI